jgi:cytochrome c oxidase subunit III
VCALFGLVLLAIRVLEFGALNVKWDDNAYGSALWVLLGLHSAHLLTDVYDTIVLAALFFFSKPIEGKRHVDVAENGIYWYFVVYAWIPVYAVIYWVPRIPA